MNSPRRKLTPSSSVESLKKEAKRWLHDLRSGNPEALARFKDAHPSPPGNPGLREVQFALAREHGFDGWIALTQALGALKAAREGVAPRAERKPLLRPRDMRDDQVWDMIRAAHAGDLARMKQLAAARPGLALAEYNYTPPIHFAVREGHTEMVRWLLEEQGADPAYRSYPFGESLLGLAEDHQHHDIARMLRERLARRFPIAEGLRELFEAAKRGDVAAARAELARDPSLAAAADEKGDTALHLAAQKGHVEMARLLLEAGARVDAQRDDGKRPINFVLGYHYNRDMVRLLLDHGADYNIFIAAWLGDRDAVREALARDPALANFQDSCTEYPIQAAAARGDHAMAKLLLDHGADPNRASLGAPRGGALWSASYRNDLEMARLLVAHGADPNADVESSGSVMMHAMKHPEMRELLARHGGREVVDKFPDLKRLLDEQRWDELERAIVASGVLDTQDSGNWGEGILAGPARDGNHRLIELLARLGARVPDVSKWGRYYYFKHPETAALLLRLGMNPNHRNWHWVTLLHDMAQDGDIPKATLLLDHGADINAIDLEYRSTPLGFAARWGKQEMVAFLLARGADVHAAGEPWATPLAWARRKRHPAIEGLLKEAGATA